MQFSRIPVSKLLIEAQNILAAMWLKEISLVKLGNIYTNCTWLTPQGLKEYIHRCKGSCCSLCKAIPDYLWQMMAIWKKALVFCKGKENTGPFIFTSVPGKVMDQLIPEIISKHIEDENVTKISQHGFMKGISYLASLVVLIRIFGLFSMVCSMKNTNE